jgi:hypothetical protein
LPAVAACDRPEEAPRPKIDGIFGIKFGQKIDPKDIIERQDVFIRLYPSIPHSFFDTYRVTVTKANTVSIIEATGRPSSYDECLPQADSIAATYKAKYDIEFKKDSEILSDPVNGPTLNRTDWTAKTWQSTSLGSGKEILIFISCTLTRSLMLGPGKEPPPFPLISIRLIHTYSIGEPDGPQKTESDAF